MQENNKSCQEQNVAEIEGERKWGVKEGELMW